MKRRAISFSLFLAMLLSITGTAQAATYGYVDATGLYIRESASTSAKALRCAERGEKLEILRDEGDWYYVRYGVVYGYVASDFVSSSPSGSSSSSSADEDLPDRISDLGDAPATSREGDRGDDVKKLQQALKILGFLKGNCDGIFGEQTLEAVKAFQKSRGLSQDGIAGKVTIKLIFGEDAADADSSSGNSGIKTEKLDWFDGGSSLIPKGTYFDIKDVRTGTVIRVRLLYGSNHLDVEPATKEDTAKLKQVYGGVWSWDRRPVLVKYGSRVIAASMNGMPHGEQAIYDNDFDGQFCIHFLNSKTHGSDKVDADHQYCVNVAAQYTW
ncbi:MAG TPA: peptidoglycan-binding protein [Candidatus Avichristensenella intestinipullorum]|uniref:Peptidoglycan-binding protein n=1 Tax=Candidatus Avichristensenella intestinipullorum TaxID=2840693 RepID=A0A9D0YU55_9FIRM|nr:peptidoglycan-binding protein [Candidatus Avichristensenella intestinipullorum]